MDKLKYPGDASCPGCGGVLAIKLALKVLGKKTYVVVPASCMSVIEGLFPKTAFNVPLLNIAFASAAAAISGLSAWLKKQGLDRDITVLGFAGDGGTVDIGIQALSGALERGHNFVFICYDNEAYMNTGIQRSGSTPFGAWTTTTPVGKLRRYKKRQKKDLPKIIAAHNIPYMATASIGYPKDYMKKVAKAKEIYGPTFIQVHAPCPPGWKFSSERTIEIARLAIKSGLWILYEIENNKMKITKKITSRIDVKEYIKTQGRFKHLNDEEISLIQKNVDEYYNEFFKDYSENQ
jgi:pyruvate ferredoxin oxidoreductase beta subunit